ncbi:hypothetical protein [uncultured Campylobacter sp.]|nr:hypothetical protein [uncultured Campylobacter sp.]
MKRFETTRTWIILVQNSKISLYFIVFILRSSKDGDIYFSFILMIFAI